MIGMSGGEGAVIADHADEAGIAMPEVSVAFTELVGEKLTLAGAGNPFDPTGEAIGRQQNALDAMTGFITLNDYDVYLLALNAQAVPAEGGCSISCWTDCPRPGAGSASRTGIFPDTPMAWPIG